MIYRKVVGILSEILNLDEDDITSDMELTSENEVERIHVAKMVIECEKKFKITIHDENVSSFRKVKDVVKYIENSLSENEGKLSVSSDEERVAWYY